MTYRGMETRRHFQGQPGIQGGPWIPSNPSSCLEQPAAPLSACHGRGGQAEGTLTLHFPQDRARYSPTRNPRLFPITAWGRVEPAGNKEAPRLHGQGPRLVVKSKHVVLDKQVVSKEGVPHRHDGIFPFKQIHISSDSFKPLL